MTRHHLAIAAMFCLAATGFAAQPVTPESPAIWREVTGVTNLWVGTNATPMFTRPHIPSLRTTVDGRVAIVVEGGGVEGGTPRFTLMMPEKMTQPFLLSPAGSYTMSQTNFKYLDTGTSSTNYTIGGKGASHACLWDPTDGVLNPWVDASLRDVYDLKVFVTTRTANTNITNTTIYDAQFFVTPIRVIVSNPKTTNAAITSITKTGPTVGGPVFTNCSAFEPVIVGDGRLLVTRVGSGSRSWINPTNNVVQPAAGMDIIYSYYTNSTAQADVAKWTNLVPITFAPYDPRLNQTFGFAMAPFRDGEGTLIPPGEDVGGSYPWMDREAKNLFMETVFDQLHYSTNGLTNWVNSRYPQTNVVEEAADYTQGEDGGKHQGVAFLGLWSHGKLVQLDNLNNEVDYAVGQGDTRADGTTPTTGPQQRMVKLYLTNSGPFGNESGWLRMGYGRATKKMPKGENDNGDIIDSLENLFNYRTNFLPISLRDVAWPVGSGSQTDELSFDDYLDPDAFIIANMAGLLTFPTNYSGSGANSYTHHSGWSTSTKSFSLPVKLQNAATAKTNRWIVPKHGLVIGNGRLEPAANGGVHGKGFSMDGSIGLEFVVTNQPQSVYTNNWYVGIFVDCRFVNDTTNRLLLSFPDGSSIQLYGRSQVLYADAFGSIVHRITIPTVVTNLPASAMDDLLPDRDWAHLAFQIRKGGTEVDFHLNGIIYNRWQDLYTSLFQFPPGRMTIGKNTNGIFNALLGFAGWVDDFKVIAHAVDYETACNHANGTLIGLPSTYTNEWKTRFADRFPAWTQDEITKVLRNNGETNYSKYANFYDYRKDNGAYRGNIPAGTVSLRQSVHFPEGPLFHNAPRPHSAANTFCLSCHHTSADGGLDLTAITLDTFWNAANDPRRQPMQPRQMILGQIPAGLVDKTGLPTVATTTPPTGQPIDQWLLAASNAAPVVKSFTVVDALTRRDLVELTNNAVIDPARLGATNLTLRANLDSAQGSVTLQYDSYASNSKSRPPYTAFGTISSPYVGSNLVAGAHTIKATPQSGTLSNLNFTVAGGVARVVAGYRADFKTHSPLPGWNYEWNAAGSISNRANYRYLSWSPGPNKFTASGSVTYPDNTITNGPYVALTSTGGHPGRGTAQGAGGFDRFAIASYTAKLAGYYGLTNTFVTCTSTNGNGGQLIVYTDTNGGATFTQKTNRLYGAGTTANFNLNTGFLQAGDTIYVEVGPNTNDGNDGFTLDFNILFKETGNPLP
ncbi:MAG: hypothetical protein HZA89_18005 [Verrucomicrobia bacterium]|nr:hypothetical protein [Verrucomicrobiota bacterium]